MSQRAAWQSDSTQQCSKLPSGVNNCTDLVNLHLLVVDTCDNLVVLVNLHLLVVDTCDKLVVLHSLLCQGKSLWMAVFTSICEIREREQQTMHAALARCRMTSRGCGTGE
jgi:hypothetical protein